jgi:DNA repair protein RadA/Sms
MAKTKTVFVCQNCGAESSKWVGKCYACGEWNTYVEEIAITGRTKDKRLSLSLGNDKQKPVNVSSVTVSDIPRIDTGIMELNRVLGGGMVPGSLILLGGEPGIGKSTLVLQMALKLKSQKILYISGEESPQQIKLRADRLSDSDGDHCFLVGETSLEQILMHIENENPGFVVIDSIQTMERESIESAPGSVSQIRECTASILKVAKEKNIPVLLIGHINKEGNLSRPKVLEHMSGIAISAAMEGIRPFMIEVQALASSAAYGTPQRSSTGFDLRRLNMLLAVLEKRAGFKLAAKDVFLNIAGGLKVSDPAIDLAVVTSILSSNTDLTVPRDTCLTGEVGLSGEIRPVTRIEQRVSEAEKLGFKAIVVPRYNKGFNPHDFNIKVVQASKIEEAFRFLLD